MAVDRTGSLWVVTRESVHKYDGKTWTQVLCPYVAKSVHRELPELYGIAIETNGNVWIGGTVYGEPKEPWEHEGLIWVVDQERRKRNGGPPMAPVFEFDGKRWRAFGPPHGLNVKWTIPELDSRGRIALKSPKKRYYIREGDTWKSVTEADVIAGKRWVLREGKGGLSRRGSELLFRDGEHLVEVQPTNAQTGEVLDLESEQFVSLEMAEDPTRGCVWLGTFHGLYRIWREEE